MCVWLPGPGAYHRGSFSSPEIFSQDCRLQCGDRCLEVLLSDDGGEVFLTAAKVSDFHGKKSGVLGRSEWGDFLLRFLEGYLKKMCQTFQMDWFHTRIVSEFFGESLICWYRMYFQALTV